METASRCKNGPTKEDRCLKDQSNYFYDVFDHRAEKCQNCERFEKCRRYLQIFTDCFICGRKTVEYRVCRMETCLVKVKAKNTNPFNAWFCASHSRIEFLSALRKKGYSFLGTRYGHRLTREQRIKFLGTEKTALWLHWPEGNYPKKEELTADEFFAIYGDKDVPPENEDFEKCPVCGCPEALITGKKTLFCPKCNNPVQRENI